MNEGLHIYRCLNPKRTRRQCPFHKKLEYGELQEFYDTTRIFFDCGTFVDGGYGYYVPPKQYKHLQIFWDSSKGKYVLVATYNWEHLFEHKDHNKILAIAQQRLKAGGKIKDA